MNPIDQIWRGMKKKDAEFIREKRIQVANYKKRFLAIPSEKIKNLNSVEFFETILEIYTNLALFPDKVVLDKFREIGFNKIFLRWFVNLADILSEFRRIEKNEKIKLLRIPAIGFINLHLNVKIKHELFQWCGYVAPYKNNPETSLLYLSFLKLYKQRQTIRKKPIKHKDLYSKLMHEMIDDFNTITKGIYDPEKYIKDFTRGKSEAFFLKELLNSGVFKDKSVSKRKFYIAIYDLFRLLVKDYPMLTHPEFKKLNYVITWDTYRYRRIQQIVERK